MINSEHISKSSKMTLKDGTYNRNSKIITVEDVGRSENIPKKLPCRLPRAFFKKNLTFDIPKEAIVVLTMKNSSYMYEGKVLYNPKQDGTKKIITLINTYRLNKRTSKRNPSFPITSGVLSFLLEDIKDIYIISYPIQIMKKIKETSMKTLIVRNQAQFRSMVNSMENFVSYVGVKMFGDSNGRFLDLYWLLLATNETLFPIDFKQPELQSTELWILLKEKIFENRNIMKIFYRMFPETDFLYHGNTVEQPIEIVNGYDTQIASYLIDLRKNAYFQQKIKDAGEESYTVPPRFCSLSVLLMRYLRNTICDKEIALIRHFESKHILTNEKFIKQPLPDYKTLKYMALTVKYLEPLRNVLESSIKVETQVFHEFNNELIKQNPSMCFNHFHSNPVCSDEFCVKMDKLVSTNLCLNEKDVQVKMPKIRMRASSNGRKMAVNK